MSFEQLKEAILAEAEKRVHQIENEAAQARRQEEARITEAGREIEERMITAAHIEGQREASRMQQERQLKAKSAVLEAKQAELAAAQAEAVKKLLEMNEQETEQLLRSLLDLLPEDEGELVAGEKHRQALRRLARGRTVAEETIPDDGGFAFRSPSTEINLTLRHLLAQVFARHRAQLAHILFG
jgi:vacuolar-type H+-ATPase subunit E/Vma4